jgi:hypothetical protein
MDNDLSHGNLSNELNTIFIVKQENGDLPLELTEVTARKLVGQRNEQFSIIFRGPSDQSLGQGTQHMEHKRFGELDLFIVPIRQDGTGLFYEAVFNRFLDQV